MLVFKCVFMELIQFMQLVRYASVDACMRADFFRVARNMLPSLHEYSQYDLLDRIFAVTERHIQEAEKNIGAEESTLHQRLARTGIHLFSQAAKEYQARFGAKYFEDGYIKRRIETVGDKLVYIPKLDSQLKTIFDLNHIICDFGVDEADAWDIYCYQDACQRGDIDAMYKYFPLMQEHSVGNLVEDLHFCDETYERNCRRENG